MASMTQNTYRLIELQTAHLRAYDLDEALLVFHQPSATLTVVSGVACWLLLSIDQGLSDDEILAEYTAQNSTPPNPTTLSAMISSLLPLFTTTETAPYQQEYAYLLQRTPAINQSTANMKNLCLTVNTLHFQIFCEASILINELSILCNIDICLTPPSIDIQFVITPVNENPTLPYTKQSYRLYCNDVILHESVPFQCLLPLLMDYMQILSYQSQSYLLAVHASTVLKDGNALILPGISGSGKSTLCVSLIKQGYICYSDEIAILSSPDGFVSPLILPMAVKTGSWPILNADWPELATAPIWQRPDGRQLKYLAIPPVSRPIIGADEHNNPPTNQYIVFPHYDSQCTQAKLQKLSVIESLKGLTQAGYQVPNTLTQQSVTQLLTFAYKTPAFALHYATLAEAHSLIDTLLSPSTNSKVTL